MVNFCLDICPQEIGLKSGINKLPVAEVSNQKSFVQHDKEQQNNNDKKNHTHLALKKMAKIVVIRCKIVYKRLH